MNYYVAPMEGLTDRVWRQAHQKWFAFPGAPARYYAPFLSPPENRVLIKKKMAELAPEANPDKHWFDTFHPTFVHTNDLIFKFLKTTDTR